MSPGLDVNHVSGLQGLRGKACGAWCVGASGLFWSQAMGLLPLGPCPQGLAGQGVGKAAAASTLHPALLIPISLFPYSCCQ